MTTRREITGYNGSQIDLWCTDGGYCTKPWILVSTPAQGYAAATDINADTSVDSADLAMLLGMRIPILLLLASANRSQC